ncbi:hypothetical protein GAY28_35870, partial [Azospirillum brasilense]|nr:hypothetical protein [Azospirillum brasilense]
MANHVASSLRRPASSPAPLDPVALKPVMGSRRADEDELNVAVEAEDGVEADNPAADETAENAPGPPARPAPAGHRPVRRGDCPRAPWPPPR